MAGVCVRGEEAFVWCWWVGVLFCEVVAFCVADRDTTTENSKLAKHQLQLPPFLRLLVPHAPRHANRSTVDRSVVNAHATHALSSDHTPRFSLPQYPPPPSHTHQQAVKK
jgi:hypothetical protein